MENERMKTGKRRIEEKKRKRKDGKGKWEKMGKKE